MCDHPPRPAAAAGFTTTEAARRFIARMLRLAGQSAGGMQLRITPGGCSGDEVGFECRPAAAEGEVELAAGDGLRLFTDAAGTARLSGKTLDFRESATQSGLVVLDPAGHACQCGGPRPLAQTTISLAAIPRRAAAASPGRDPGA